MVGFSASSPNVVGLRLPFSLFVIGCSSVPVAVEDGLLRLFKAEISVLPPLGEELRTDHPRLGRKRQATTKVSICKFICRYEETLMISHTPGSGKASKFTADAKKILEEQMEKNDETTGIKLQKLLAKNDIQVASSTALR